MKRNPLTRKEDFINNMILNAHENTKGFHVGEISNGIFTFDDLTGFILLKGLSEEFKEYYENNKDTIGEYVDMTNIFNIEICKDDLPFGELEKDYKKGEM